MKLEELIYNQEIKDLKKENSDLMKELESRDKELDRRDKELDRRDKEFRKELDSRDKSEKNFRIFTLLVSASAICLYFFMRK